VKLIRFVSDKNTKIKQGNQPVFDDIVNLLRNSFGVAKTAHKYAR